VSYLEGIINRMRIQFFVGNHHYIVIYLSKGAVQLKATILFLLHAMNEYKNKNTLPHKALLLTCIDSVLLWL